MSTPALPALDTSGFPPAPTSDLAQALAAALKRAGAAEDHLAREVRSAQALQDRVTELEALCAHLGVAATFHNKAAVFLDLAEVRETAKVDDHARDRSGCRLCAAAMVLHRTSPSDEAEVLLLQRASTASYGAGAWTLPAGGVTPADRSLIDTAARELLEETGLILNGCPRVVRLVDGLTPTTGGRAYACAIVLGTVTHPHVVYNREPDTHSGARWFKVADLPAETWDREMLVEIMGREEDAHWSNDAAANPSITQGMQPRDFFVALDNAEKTRNTARKLYVFRVGDDVRVARKVESKIETWTKHMDCTIGSHCTVERTDGDVILLNNGWWYAPAALDLLLENGGQS